MCTPWLACMCPNANGRNVLCWHGHYKGPARMRTFLHDLQVSDPLEAISFCSRSSPSVPCRPRQLLVSASLPLPGQRAAGHCDLHCIAMKASGHETEAQQVCLEAHQPQCVCQDAHHLNTPTITTNPPKKNKNKPPLVGVLSAGSTSNYPPFPLSSKQ